MKLVQAESKGFSDTGILREDKLLDYKVACQPVCGLYSFYLDTRYFASNTNNSEEKGNWIFSSIYKQ